ncbi:MAG: hypothetical protein Q8O13_11220 [Candidatus Omnitrophota bacterium]|nr:hypothetical protein [Candidatus Omnitrophota bacterium]
MDKHAQISLEAIILIIIVVAALLTMDIYLKRAIQGRWRGASDEIGEQYEYGHTNSDFTFSVVSNTETLISTEETRQGEGNVVITTNRVDLTDMSETKTGTEYVEGY